MMSDGGMQGINGSSKRPNETQSGVVEYLSKLGLDEGDLAKVAKLLKAINKDGQPSPENQLPENQLPENQLPENQSIENQSIENQSIENDYFGVETTIFQPGAMLDLQHEEPVRLAGRAGAAHRGVGEDRGADHRRADQ